MSGASAAARGPRPMRDRVAGSLAVVFLVGFSGAILLAPAPWFHDFAEWLFQAQVLGLKLRAPASVSGYVMADYPVPNSIGLLLLAGLTLLLPPLYAGKLLLVGMLVGWWLLLRGWVRRFGGEDARGAMQLTLFLTFGLSTFFWYGYLNYQVGLLLLLWFLLRWERSMGDSELAAWGVLLFLAHAMVALVWLVVVMARLSGRLRLARSVDAQRQALLRTVLVGAPSALLAFWYLQAKMAAASMAAGVDADTGGWLEALVYKGGFPLMLGSFRNLLWPDGSAVFEQVPVLYWIGAACNLLVIIVLAFWGAAVLWAHRVPGGTDADPGRRIVWASCLALVAAYLLMPYQFFGMVNPAGRLLVPLLALASILGGKVAWVWRWSIWPATTGACLTLAQLALFVHALPPGQVAHPMPFKPADAPSASVFAFNAALYPDTRFKYFNFRLTMGSERYAQLQSQSYRGLGFRTGLLVDFQPMQE